MPYQIPACISAISLTILTSACTIHPTIEDVTNYTAYDIVRKTRCEAREVLIAKFTKFLSGQERDPAALSLAKQLMHDPDSINNADFRPLANNTKEVIDKVGKSAIALDFSLNITENNSNSGAASIIKSFPSGTRSLGMSASADFTRNNLSAFLITDTFITLLKDIEPIYCYKYNFEEKAYTKFNTKTPNYIYPMAGNIGISKSIDVFVNMSLFAPLQGKEKGPPTMSDALEFTTRFTGSANPALTFLPGVPGTRLASDMLTGTAYREDKHKVIIGLSLPPSDPKSLEATDVFAGNLVTVSSRATPAEVQASNAVSQHILRFDVGQRNPTPIIVQSLFPFF